MTVELWQALAGGVLIGFGAAILLLLNRLLKKSAHEAQYG